jgi:hypothetical protein
MITLMLAIYAAAIAGAIYIYVTNPTDRTD